MNDNRVFLINQAISPDSSNTSSLEIKPNFTHVDPLALDTEELYVKYKVTFDWLTTNYVNKIRWDSKNILICKYALAIFFL